MTELKFSEYWIVILNRNPEYDREQSGHQDLMKKHFQFIDDQSEKGNMFVAIPMSSGGLYIFDGDLDETYMKQVLEEEGSIKGGVFIPDLRRAYVPSDHVIFVMENMKRIDGFNKARKQKILT